MLSFIAFFAPAIIPIASVIVMLEAMAEWRWHVLISVPVLVGIAAVIFCRTAASSIYVRALALMNIGRAADLVISMWVPQTDNTLIYKSVPLAALLPLLWCLVAWFRQETGSSIREKTHAARISLMKTFGAGLTLCLPILCGYPVLFQSSGKDSVGRQDNIHIVMNLKKWLPIYQLDERKFLRQLIKARYLWYDEARFNRIGNWTPFASIFDVAKDPNDGWSYITKSSDETADHQGEKQGFGIGIILPKAGGDLILKVDAQSAAHRAGLQRGDTVVSVDGIPVSSLNKGEFKSKGIGYVGAFAIVRKNLQLENLEIPRTSYTLQRVGDPKVLVAGDHKVGYLEYGGFEESARQPLESAIRTLQDAKISDFVLDLRYNGGGSVSEEIRLSGMLAPTEAINKLAARALGRNQLVLNEHRLSAEQHQPRLQLFSPRLFVITSENTCSASEALVMALRAYMPVITIGTTTCGKPFGMRVEEYGGTVYSLVTFSVENSRGEGGYTEGLKPTCQAVDDPQYELGDRREGSLAEALYYIEHGRCSNAVIVNTS